MMVGNWPAPGMVIDHRDRDVTNNAWSNLREVTVSENNCNADHGCIRLHGLDMALEQGVHKRPSGNYSVQVLGVWGGTYRSPIEANQVARQMRRALKGTHDFPFVSWRYHG